MRKGLALILVVVCAVVSQGTTCNNQDFTIIEPIDFDLEQNDVEGLTPIANDYEARTTVDFVIQNRADTTMFIELAAATTDIDLDSELPDTPDDSGECVTQTIGAFVNNRRQLQVCAGESYQGRFAEDELNKGIVVNMAIVCLSAVCLGTLDMAIVQAQLECRDDTECSADEACELQSGRCVSINNNGGGCQTAPAQSPAPLWPALILLAIGALLVAGRARRPLVAAAMLAAVFLVPTDAEAQRSDWRRPSAQTTFGVGIRDWTGSLDNDARPGVNLTWTQSLQFKYLGGFVKVGTAFFLTDQDPPPFEKGLQTYSLSLGPRGMLAWKDARFFVDLEYERIGVISNALVRKTGPELGFNGLGGGLGARYLIGPLTLDVRVSYVQVLEFGAGLFGVNFEVGLNNSLR